MTRRLLDFRGGEETWLYFHYKYKRNTHLPAHHNLVVNRSHLLSTAHLSLCLCDSWVDIGAWRALFLLLYYWFQLQLPSAMEAKRWFSVVLLTLLLAGLSINLLHDSKSFLRYCIFFLYIFDFFRSCCGSWGTSDLLIEVWKGFFYRTCKDFW